MDPLTLTLAVLAKAKSAATMAGLMLDSDDPPLCTNVLHNELTCAHSELPRDKWCEACTNAC